MNFFGVGDDDTFHGRPNEWSVRDALKGSRKKDFCIELRVSLKSKNSNLIYKFNTPKLI